MTRHERSRHRRNDTSGGYADPTVKRRTKVFQRSSHLRPLSLATVECGVCKLQVRVYEDNGAMGRHKVGMSSRESWPCPGGGH